VSPATLHRLTLRGLLRPSRATRRPIYWVKELERFLMETTEADYIFPHSGASSLPGQSAKKQSSARYSKSNIQAAFGGRLGMRGVRRAIRAETFPLLTGRATGLVREQDHLFLPDGSMGAFGRWDGARDEI